MHLRCFETHGDTGFLNLKSVAHIPGLFVKAGGIEYLEIEAESISVNSGCKIS
jgi:hypothetical protein